MGENLLRSSAIATAAAEVVVVVVQRIRYRGCSCPEARIPLGRVYERTAKESQAVTIQEFEGSPRPHQRVYFYGSWAWILSS